MIQFNSQNIFSPNYLEARQHFLKTAQLVGAELTAHPLSSKGAKGETLTIDIATLGAKNPQRTILLTSGLHGVEGFLGSAIQIAWLKNLKANPISFDSTAVVLVHALNPYGFSWQRRVNENNVDLNRNFILPHQKFSGSPPKIKKIPWLQKPISPKDKFFIIELYMIRTILDHGFAVMRDSLLHGQFDYPSGLFWGGHKFEEATRIIQDQVNEWTRLAPNIIHVDFHTSIGQYGNCQLLTFEQNDSKRRLWLESQFGPVVSSFGTGLISSDKPQGCMGEWLAHHFELQNKNYIYLIAEFGTHPILRAFKAFYQENRFHNHPGQEYELAKKELLEVACPEDPAWREKCVTEGLQTISKALHVRQDFEI
jgi:hypothetical protein